MVTHAEIVRLARAAGWQVLHLSAADQREWDDFEATWRRSRQQWLFDQPHDSRAAPDVQDTLDAQLMQFVEVYRGAWLRLSRARQMTTPPRRSFGVNYCSVPILLQAI